MRGCGFDRDSKLEGVRLGHRPDADIAAEVGVTPGAVTAERSRRGIAKYRPTRGPLRGERLAMTAEEKREACQ